MSNEDFFSFPSKGAPPWSEATHSFAGWVPSIAGHLSFSEVGTDKAVSGCCALNEELPRSDRPVERVIFLHKERKNRDRLRFLPLPLPKEAKHDFFFIGRTSGASANCSQKSSAKSEIWDEQGVLSGMVLLLPRAEDGLPAWKEFRNELISLIMSDEPPDDLEALPEYISQSLLDARADKVVCLAMQFAVFRSGEARIWFDDEHFYGSPDVQAIVETDPKFPDNVASQAYFFLKEAIHLHYHHPREDDQLLPFVRLENSGGAASHTDDEIEWRRQTLWGLARIVTQFRRRENRHDQTQALGVIAYAETFQQSQVSIVRTNVLDHDKAFEPCNRIAGYDFSHTKASVEASGKILERRASNRSQSSAVLIALAIALLALWQSTLSLSLGACAGEAQPSACEMIGKISRDSAAVQFSALVLEYPTRVYLVLFTIGALWTIFGQSDRSLLKIIFASAFVDRLSRVANAIGVSFSRFVARKMVLEEYADGAGKVLAGLLAVLASATLFGAALYVAL